MDCMCVRGGVVMGPYYSVLNYWLVYNNLDIGDSMNILVLNLVSEQNLGVKWDWRHCSLLRET